MTDIKIENSRKKTPLVLYLLGLLCLIPVVGLFVGVAYIVIGLVYKDKWIVLIGSVGIVITIALYSWLHRMTIDEQNPTIVLAKKELTRHSLNETIKTLEFYKQQHGTYPNTINDLRKESPLSFISDPFCEVGNSEERVLKYTKLDSGYTLFSVGPDKIAQTKDDIYPTNIERTGFINDVK